MIATLPAGVIRRPTNPAEHPAIMAGFTANSSSRA